MKRKSVLALVLTLAMLFGLVSCKGNPLPMDGMGDTGNSETSLTQEESDNSTLNTTVTSVTQPENGSSTAEITVTTAQTKSSSTAKTTVTTASKTKSSSSTVKTTVTTAQAKSSSTTKKTVTTTQTKSKSTAKATVATANKTKSSSSTTKTTVTTTTQTKKAESPYEDWPSIFQKESGAATVISTNTCLGQNGNYDFAGIYVYGGDLTVEKDVQITSSGISQLVIVVNGTLTMKSGSAIRVRNGYYSDLPTMPISSLNEVNVASYATMYDNIMLFEGCYGRGGDGGNGGDGNSGNASQYCASGNGGYGGRGGFGGGERGSNGKGGQTYIAGSTPSSNEVNAGSVATGTNVGGEGYESSYAGPGGGGNGGNAGGSGYSTYQKVSGIGGGGGGYGGGVLSIYAKKIVIEDESQAVFVALGQFGGKKGFINGTELTNERLGAEDGYNGEGGMVVIKADEYEYAISHFISPHVDDDQEFYDDLINPLKSGATAGNYTVYDGGHSSMVHTVPQYIYICGGKSFRIGMTYGEMYSNKSNSSGSNTGGNSEGNSGGHLNGGTGNIETYDIPCTMCEQTGRLECGGCDGEGEVLSYYDINHNKVMKRCYICNGTGQRTCYYCNGDGIYGN